MDVVALAQHGVEFAVATLGTATTPIHARTLLRHTDRLIFAFDGDNAGRKAAWRALENTLEALQDGKEVSFLFLPEGEDPDSYIRTHGHARFLQLLDNDTLPLSAFLVRELARGRKLDSQEGQAALLKDARPLLEKIAAPLLGSLIRKQIAELAHLQADELSQMGFKSDTNPPCRPASPAPPRTLAPAQPCAHTFDEPEARCRSGTAMARHERSAGPAHARPDDLAARGRTIEPARPR